MKQGQKKKKTSRLSSNKIFRHFFSKAWRDKSGAVLVLELVCVRVAGGGAVVGVEFPLAHAGAPFRLPMGPVMLLRRGDVCGAKRPR